MMRIAHVGVWLGALVGGAGCLEIPASQGGSDAGDLECTRTYRFSSPDEYADFFPDDLPGCFSQVMNDRLEFTAEDSTCEASLDLNFTVDLTVDHVSVVLVVPGGGTNAEFGVFLENADGLNLSLTSGTLEAQACDALDNCSSLMTRAFSPVNDRIFRLSYASGLVQAETSADGGEWSMLGSLAADAANVDAAGVFLGTFGGGAPGMIEFDDLEVCRALDR